jgi:hypothetical protein
MRTTALAGPPDRYGVSTRWGRAPARSWVKIDTTATPVREHARKIDTIPSRVYPLAASCQHVTICG